uniref:NADH-ubiquinone oxidoreductase chain 3 n=1 Tax=Centrorhynchus aluconis TaxID=1795424 RepID=A0A140DJ63_9BILA|nr:NADH dehydrogenase subunit 3 [Centrorhynchus aluconis]
MGVVVGLLTGFVLVGAVVLTALVVANREEIGVEGESGFESGFMAMVSEMQPLSVRFFVVGLVFLLLDMETAVLISTPLSLSGLIEGSGLLLLGVVWVYVIGTLYEWYAGSLDWFL